MEFNKYGMDQYDSFLVCADNLTECKELIEEDHKSNWISDVNWSGGFIIKKIGKTNRAKGVIMASYNAG